MFARLFRRARSSGDIADALYGAIVAQARSPAFYRDLGVPDTVEGRFEMVVMHTALLTRRLMRKGREGEAETGQAVFDVFCREMDRAMREMGVGDLAVPKKMRKVGQAFYGRSAVYDSALDAGDAAALAAALGRNVLGEGADGVAAAGLATYMIAADRALADARTIGPDLPFPDAAAFLPESRP